ncbi:HD domain-containing protein [Chryseobacterium balustinum]|uniref:Bifunctional (P)ppGpp synthase/hydrolase SpoT n=1 Tax=Chryseobacterium balustinum TaxID=246 RepID=A0AAX2IS65_9FLAO|nr:HD domain-containing protein [Chryseobacterium balustinum]AZB28468.1 bifunctional (p)ppGpp synthetase/guanosine-3',5'-bis(diphosphate) 3'-pyrophosphohydrolase [Chryseobacterium balustinum]SKC09885.1 HD domain-containing protein [Chryseobacterium balustinum]SQA92537.1 Bifunctional (p)ppGpp synthase/hydrolase SpoT [Chryseobacterium balustinum]
MASDLLFLQQLFLVILPMDHSEIINKIIEFADKAHEDQTRKYTPDKYIVHPIRVMETCKQYTDELPVLAAAILHDVIEDTATSQDHILHFLKDLLNENDRNQTITLVIELTDVYVKKDFPKLNRDTRKKMELERLRKISARAQTIKYADIIDNSKEIPQHDPFFAKRYLKECNDILLTLDRGLPKLRNEAINQVVTILKNLQIAR